MTTILDTIFEAKRRRVEKLRASTDRDDLISRARAARSLIEPHRFRTSVSNSERINVIAEFKRASPSKGLINAKADAAEIARQYKAGGAAAISVLTEEDFFRGSLDDLRGVRAEVDLPILRKDFTFDELQVYESAAAGADAILLIVASLSKQELTVLRDLAVDLGMDALVEVHTTDEMKVASDIDAKLIGVNNRDLRTFNVSLDISRELIALAPPDATIVAESGLKTHYDLAELRSLGYSAFLIGETLMKSGDIGGELRRLTGISAK